jgi:hypothetical protein
VDVVLIVLLVIVAVLLYRTMTRSRQLGSKNALADALADARRWYERLGGQLMNLSGDDPAVRQALADAGERYNAAGGQLEQAKTPAQAALARDTALEGLHYIHAARTAMGLDPGPALPAISGQQRAGQVGEDREVAVEGHTYRASPNPSDRTTHYYPGGTVAGRPVPRGWYSEPFWKTALVGGAWGLGSALLFSSLFGGMAGVGMGGFGDGYGEGYQDAAQEFGGDGGGDGGGDAGGDGGGGDSGGGDMGGGGSDWFGGGGGGDWFGGGDGGGGFDFGGGGE